MCLAIPAIVTKINGYLATIEIEGVKRSVSTALVPSLKVGDYIITHAGFALHIIDEAEALESIKLLNELIESVPKKTK